MLGITTGFGTMGPALAEGRAVSTALSSLAQQPDASSTITRTLFVGLAMIESIAIYCLVISMILIFAQAVNFLILVWLLKRFLDEPILHAIDEREKGIASQLAQAEAKVAEAQKERDDFQHKNEIF